MEIYEILQKIKADLEKGNLINIEKFKDDEFDFIN